jgi:flagellar basal-body rod modification protein FlgD
MATALAATGNSLLASLAQPASSNAKSQTLEDKFMTLLLTQVRNQDPLNPLDNTTMTSQLAQISTVNGIDKLNTTVQQMSASFLAAQQLQAGSLIGHGVLAQGDTIALANGKATGGLVLDQPADDVVVQVFGPAGQRLATIDLGARSAGINTFTWDGKTDSGAPAPEGTYTFQVNAVRANQKLSVQTLGYGLVQSVTLDPSNPVLNTIGLGAVALSDVKQIL